MSIESRHSLIYSVDDEDEVITEEENGDTGSQPWNSKRLEKSLRKIKAELDRNEKFLDFKKMSLEQSQRAKVEASNNYNTETEMSMDNISSSSGKKRGYLQKRKTLRHSTFRLSYNRDSMSSLDDSDSESSISFKDKKPKYKKTLTKLRNSITHIKHEQSVENNSCNYTKLDLSNIQEDLEEMSSPEMVTRTKKSRIFFQSVNVQDGDNPRLSEFNITVSML